MRKHVFRRIFLLSMVILVISIGIIELYIANVVRDEYTNNLKENLFMQAGLLADVIPFRHAGNLDELCRELKLKTGSRVTVIDINGKVLGDSDNSSASMADHADRIEVQQALESGTGSAIRYSETLKFDSLYATKKIVREGEALGIIRLAVPMNKIYDSINSLRLKISLIVISVFLLSGGLLLWQTERLRRLVNQVVEYADALAHGFFRRRLYLEEAGEFTSLAQSLNHMAEELGTSMAQGDEKANRLKVIIQNIPDALLLINTHSIVEISNNAARDIFKINQPEGRPFIEVVRSPEFSSLIEQVKEQRTTGSSELVIDFPAERHLSVRVSPIFYKVGEVAGFAAIFNDTTQMKKLEQMRKDFVVNVSHEIKTPITAIRGFAETLLDGALYDKAHAEKFLQTIKSHSERLNRLVDDLLMISKVELGTITMNRTDVNIHDIVDHVVGTVLVQAAEKDIILKKSFTSGIDVISADRDRLEQILLNLADNAVKFTEKGEIELGTARENGRDCLFVRDTGIGIPDKYLSRVGERFFRVDPSRSRELGGTGLGLAIVKHLVKAHGWDMKIESEEGKGTVVKVFVS
ncbi:MAG: HAMP domain-containing protein [Nitrospiraceae bacterium]|nr:MAG: HAMP domain-containing protein [Nitrospiraceae bacterium]